MATKLMFISSSRPLDETRVRLEDGRELEVDDSGQIEVELDPGVRNLEVKVDDQWVSTRVDVQAGDETLVVDVDDADQDGRPSPVGRTLGGRYHIEAALGQGGMGTVYRARDTRLERDVAIKTLNDQLRSNQEASRLFLKEARQMAPLSHPHLVAVYDVATLEGYEVMVTELVEGASLADWLEARGPLGVDDALIVAYQLTVAVDYLHDQEMIHRDLKPDNAVLEEGGGVKLIDFGLARSLEHLMAKGTNVRGTPAYMAPEQVQGPGPGSATDVYQLGVTFYELLTGELPSNPDGDNVFAYATEANEPITVHRSDLPEELVELIHDCLREDPEERPAAGEVADRFAELFYERNGRRPPSNVSPGDWSPEAAATSATDAGVTGGPQVAPTLADAGDEPSTDPVESDPSEREDENRDSGVDSSRDMPGRRPDYTGASGSGDVEWDRPVARIARIVAAVAVLFAIGVFVHYIFIAEPESDGAPEPAPTDREEGEPEPDPADESAPGEAPEESTVDGDALAAEVVDRTRGLAAGLDREASETVDSETAETDENGAEGGDVESETPDEEAANPEAETPAGAEPETSDSEPGDSGETEDSAEATPSETADRNEEDEELLQPEVAEEAEADRPREEDPETGSESGETAGSEGDGRETASGDEPSEEEDGDVGETTSEPESDSVDDESQPSDSEESDAPEDQADEERNEPSDDGEEDEQQRPPRGF